MLLYYSAIIINHKTKQTFNTEKVSLECIYKFVEENFNFSVGNIIKELDLLNIKYYDLAAYGHFGREEYPWEKIKNLLTTK